MAYVNVSMTEILSFVDKNLEYNRDRIKSIKIINENQIELMVSIGPIFPNIKIVASYNKFENGKIYCNIITNGGIKMLMGLANEMGGKNINDYIAFESNRVIFDVNKLLQSNLKDVSVKDLSISGEQIYVTIEF